VELDPAAVVKESLTTAADGKRYITKYYNLDDFIRMNDSEVLTHAGTVSHMEAEQKVMLEYERYKN